MRDPFVIEIVWRGHLTHRIQITDVKKSYMRAEVACGGSFIISRGGTLTLKLPTLLVPASDPVEFSDEVKIDLEDMVELIREADL